MDLLACYQGSAVRQQALSEPPFGPAFPPADACRADRLEVWGTTRDADADFTEFRLYREGRLIGMRRIPGY